MKQSEIVKKSHGLSYYTAANPQIRALYRSGKRPTEFGNKVWATSLVLLDYLDTKPFPLQGLRVLEVGCGWGLLGVYLAKVHACDVTCTDLDEHVLPIVQLHAILNGVSLKTKRASFSELSSDFLEDFDLILGAEICYCEEAGRDMTMLVRRAFESGVEQVLIADPGRPDFEDCKAYCTKNYDTSLIELPGSVNGKTTQLLRIHSCETGRVNQFHATNGCKMK